MVSSLQDSKHDDDQFVAGPIAKRSDLIPKHSGCSEDLVYCQREVGEHECLSVMQATPTRCPVRARGNSPIAAQPWAVSCLGRVDKR